MAVRAGPTARASDRTDRPERQSLAEWSGAVHAVARGANRDVAAPVAAGAGGGKISFSAPVAAARPGAVSASDVGGKPQRPARRPGVSGSVSRAARAGGRAGASQDCGHHQGRRQQRGRQHAAEHQRRALLARQRRLRSLDAARHGRQRGHAALLRRLSQRGRQGPQLFSAAGPEPTRSAIWSGSSTIGCTAIAGCRSSTWSRHIHGLC